FDRDLLAAQLRFEIFQIGELRERTRNPMIWADDIDLSGYLLRSYAPIEQRVAAMKRHAAAISQVLKQATEVLNPRLSRPVLQTAIDVFAGVATFLRDEVPAALIESGSTESVETEFAAALVAIDAFVAELERRESESTDEFAIGGDLLHKLVSLGELVDIPLETLLRLGEEDLERNLALSRTTAARIDPNLEIAQVFCSLAHDHPRADQLVAEVSSLLESLRQFVVDHSIVSIPTESRCEVRETPGFLRWAFAMMDTAGPYEDESVESFYFVTPPEDDWTDERREEWLSNFDRSALPGISIHEAYPGHFVHFLHLRNVDSPVRRVALSYSFIEGWAHYVEEMMLEEGYGGDNPKLRLAQLREALLRNCRLVVSIKMHAFGMSVDEATETFKTQAYLEDGPARQEAIRGTFDPGYLNYTLGKLLMRKLRADVQRVEGPDFSLQAFHDRLLSLGAPPFALARRVLTPEDLAVLEG
ncbi:MAG TPA: DUF885 domain-containing protein, partial [Nitrolancea sp.]|nr:DUF885 domain-containing protein [Nitrolancea sp.]